MANIAKNSTTYSSNQSRSDYVESSAAKFGAAKFSKARFGKQTDYTAYGKITKNSITYGANPTKN